MRLIIKHMLAFAILPVLAAAATGECPAQESRQAKEPAGQITGRIQVEGKAAKSVVVVLTPVEPGPRREAIARDRTDEGGYYKLTGIRAGQYSVRPIAPAYTTSEGDFGYIGRMVTISDDEIVEGVDFTLVRGGVISGRLTDAEGRPIVGETVNLSQIDEQRLETPVYLPNYSMFETDDRGIYRIYGLPAGRYIVSAGIEPARSGMVRMGSSRGFYTRTYHPDATDKMKAAVIELEAGGEAADVDIKLGSTSKTYTARGRVVDADTGKPVAGVAVGYGAIDENAKRMMGYGWGARTNSRGEFHLDGVLPGRYAAFAVFESENEFYSETVAFQMADEEVSGLEIKVRRGASIIGAVAIEGAENAQALSQLSRLQLSFSPIQQELSSPRMSPSRVAPDGSFRLSGLRSGKGQIALAGYPPAKGFRIVRVERDGIEQPKEMEITAGEQVSNVRVVLSYGTAVIRGQVKIEGGALPQDARLYVMANRAGETGQQPGVFGEVDARGYFVIEGLAAGEYQLTLNSYSPSLNGKLVKSITQSANVAEGAETRVTFTLDLSEKEKENDR